MNDLNDMYDMIGEKKESKRKAHNIDLNSYRIRATVDLHSADKRQLMSGAAMWECGEE